MHPKIKISQRKFENLKPYFVKGARERDRQTCMCRQHIELQIVFKECMKFRKKSVRSARTRHRGSWCRGVFLSQWDDLTNPLPYTRGSKIPDSSV